jgi:plasmid stabilization system protein ParE
VARALGVAQADAAPEAVAQIVYGRRALRDLERLFAFLLEHDEDAAMASARAIRDAVELLGRHPFVGRIRAGELRELVVSFGKTGYVALYRYVAARDEIRVLAIRHQREIDFRP